MAYSECIARLGGGACEFPDPLLDSLLDPLPDLPPLPLAAAPTIAVTPVVKVELQKLLDERRAATTWDPSSAESDAAAATFVALLTAFINQDLDGLTAAVDAVRASKRTVSDAEEAAVQAMLLLNGLEPDFFGGGDGGNMAALTQLLRCAGAAVYRDMTTELRLAQTYSEIFAPYKRALPHIPAVLDVLTAWCGFEDEAERGTWRPAVSHRLEQLVMFADVPTARAALGLMGDGPMLRGILFAVAQNGANVSMDVLQACVAAGADPLAKDSVGRTPAMVLQDRWMVGAYMHGDSLNDDGAVFDPAVLREMLRELETQARARRAVAAQEREDALGIKGRLRNPRATLTLKRTTPHRAVKK